MKWLIAILLALDLSTSFAHDWTGSDPQTAEWFAHLRRKSDNMSCCGLGDAYKVRIIQEADPTHPFEEVGVAEVIDGSAIDAKMMMKEPGGEVFEDHIERPPLRNGTQFKFAYNNLAREAEGNPTRWAWAFLSVWRSTDHPENNSISSVYCVVPLPPNS